MPLSARLESPGPSLLDFEPEEGELADGVADEPSVAQLGGPK